METDDGMIPAALKAQISGKKGAEMAANFAVSPQTHSFLPKPQCLRGNGLKISASLYLSLHLSTKNE